MVLSEIVALHKLKEKTSLIYMRPSKRLGHCYINPEEPLRYGTSNSNYGYSLEKAEDLLRYDPAVVLIGVYKQSNNVLIYVSPKDLWVHSKHKDGTIKILYGQK